MRYSPVTPSILALLLVLTGCGTGGEAEAAAEGREEPAVARERLGAEPGDTLPLRQLYDSIATRHHQLMNRYREVQGRLPEDAASMYQAMDRMHGQAGEAHAGMMGGMHGPGMMREGHMRGEMRGMARSHMAREWDWQMGSMHAQMESWMRERGFDDMAELHERMASLYDRARQRLEAEDEGAAAAPDAPDGSVSGQAVYDEVCSSCHGTRGRGMAGTFPPLAGSAWATGDAETAIRIVLHGLQGPIEVAGQEYRGTMPAFGSRLSDAEVAAVLTYVRGWGEVAGTISAEDVAAVRQQYPDRREPWTAAELR